MSLSPSKVVARAVAPAELLCQARQGDKAALGALLSFHRSRMRQLALRICRSPADADDAVQEASILVLHKLAQHRPDASFSSWIHRVTINSALLILRQRRRQATSSLTDGPGNLKSSATPLTQRSSTTPTFSMSPKFPMTPRSPSSSRSPSSPRSSISPVGPPSPILFDPPDPAVPPDELCDQRRQLRAVLAMAKTLSPVLLKTLELRELNGMDGAQVARHLGVSLEVVKTRVHRARAALKASLAPTPDLRLDGRNTYRG